MRTKKCPLKHGIYAIVFSQIRFDWPSLGKGVWERETISVADESSLESDVYRSTEIFYAFCVSFCFYRFFFCSFVLRDDGLGNLYLAFYV